MTLCCFFCLLLWHLISIKQRWFILKIVLSHGVHVDFPQGTTRPGACRSRTAGASRLAQVRSSCIVRITQWWVDWSMSTLALFLQGLMYRVYIYNYIHINYYIIYINYYMYIYIHMIIWYLYIILYSMLDGHSGSILHPRGSTRYIFFGRSRTLNLLTTRTPRTKASYVQTKFRTASVEPSPQGWLAMADFCCT